MMLQRIFYLSVSYAGVAAYQVWLCALALAKEPPFIVDSGLPCILLQQWQLRYNDNTFKKTHKRTTAFKTHK